VQPRGLSLNAWALQAGVSRTVFNDIRKRNNARHDTLVKLLSAAKITLAQFEAGVQPVRTEVRSAGLPSDVIDRARFGIPQAFSVPLVGSAIGGAFDDIDEHVELTELYLSEVLDHLARPPSLDGDLGAYAVTIVGDSMAPRFDPGERALVSPRASAGIGQDVIVQLRGAPREGADPDVADRVTMVLIKRLVRRTARAITLQQFNPEMTFDIPIDRVAAVHRVVGRL
jgi:phage repressor protein C with HTH and peptisase S24 domain